MNDRNYPKVDRPDEIICFDACLGYEDAYCSSNNKTYYMTIDNCRVDELMQEPLTEKIRPL